MRKSLLPVMAIIIGAMMLGGMASAVGGDVPRIAKEDLLKDMNGGAATVIDVRTDRDWADSDKKIKGAIRQEPGEVKNWAGHYEKDKIIVLYCN